MLKKASRKSAEVKDVPADDPAGTMDRFRDGLLRVLNIKKSDTKPQRPRKKQRNLRHLA